MLSTIPTLLLAAVVALLASGCASERIPASALRLPESTMELRSIQTRSFKVQSADVIFAATVSALQDLEYNIDELQVPLGVVTASKIADADHALEKSGLFMMDLLCYMTMSGECNSLDSAQDRFQISMTMVVTPSLARPGEFIVRITLQRALFNKDGQVRNLERIEDPEIYQQLFSSLSKSLFLEENI